MVIVIFNLLLSKFVETNTTFRSASTDLDRQTRSKVSYKITIYLILGTMNNIFHITNAVRYCQTRDVCATRRYRPMMDGRAFPNDCQSR